MKALRLLCHSSLGSIVIEKKTPRRQRVLGFSGAENELLERRSLLYVDLLPPGGTPCSHAKIIKTENFRIEKFEAFT